MYDELAKRLRERSVFLFPHHGESRSYDADLMHEAADAIEELQQTAEHYKGCSDDWYREACDYKAICEQMKATVIIEAQHTEMYDERDKKTLVAMAKSLPLQIIPYNDEKPRWIPVTERLPEDGGFYITAFSKGEVGHNLYMTFADGSGKWYQNSEDTGPVTHWMEYPRPPLY